MCKVPVYVRNKSDAITVGAQSIDLDSYWYFTVGFSRSFEVIVRNTLSFALVFAVESQSNLLGKQELV